MPLLAPSLNPSQKVLLVGTNTSKYPQIPRANGAWLSEIVHFVDPLQQAGFTVDFASPSGGFIPIDPASMEEAMMGEKEWKYYASKDFLNKLATSMPISKVNVAEYRAVYFAGGHGAMWDFNGPEVRRLVQEAYEGGRIVAAVCHGLAALVDVKLSDGHLLIENKEVTGFSNGEEELTKVAEYLPYSLEDMLKANKCKYSKAQEAWGSHVRVSDRLVTGQNPSSTSGVAEKVLEQLRA